MHVVMGGTVGAFEEDDVAFGAGEVFFARFLNAGLFGCQREGQ